MKPDLFLLLCLTGIVPITISILQPVPVLYIIKKALTWPAGQAYCRTKYTDLATAKSENDLQKLKELAAINSVTWPIWIGLFDDFDSWRWSFNDLLLNKTTIRKWRSGEPNNKDGKEACAAMTTIGEWEDQTCTDLRPFICYNATYNDDDRFVGVASPWMNWFDAQAYCRKFHTDLASSTDETENGLLQQIALGQGSSWFGLFRDTWKWLNRTIALNPQWGSGQPDNYQQNEKCAKLYGGLFVDDVCSSQHYFICQLIPPVNKQIVKLQVKSDGSVFDPEVRSAILEQIKQKLMEHGMLNTTVTWRVQPDGNIFHKKSED